MFDLIDTIAKELSARTAQVEAAVKLLDDGATVPFIARYRKEITGNLDDIQLRLLQQRLGYFRELEDRRQSILKSISEQQKLSPELAAKIHAADTKTRLEDLYLPYKPKRRSKGQIAIEAGLAPLAQRLLDDIKAEPTLVAESFINLEHGIDSVKAALDGAKYILMEQFSENADLLEQLRHKMLRSGVLSASVYPEKTAEAVKFSDYFDYSEALNKIPPHRAMAMFRGRKEGYLSVKLDLATDETALGHPCEGLIAQANQLVIFAEDSARNLWLREAVRWTWRIKLQMQIETDLLGDLRSSAEDAAIKVFSDNLKDVLLAAPAGQRATIGLDPGLRTGVKVAVIDATGAYLEHTTVFPHAPQNKWAQSIATLAALSQKHKVELIAIGNGTASRETEKLVADMLRQHPELDATKVMVSEAGASVYSASELASKEFPDLDVTVRGAISIARRLQDPLAELVKTEPKSIGVGQYQHDVSQFKLAKSLDDTVEDCVNAVGVEINTASAALLKRVAGISDTLAQNIVQWRSDHGPIATRKALLKVPRMGEKSFEQCAGFLRVRQSDNPLDNSAVHPESYAVVEQIAARQGVAITQLIGNISLLNDIPLKDFVDIGVGEITAKDIVRELLKPGLDPRPKFETANFKDGVDKISDLRPDMILEGVITNVTDFGAFVDVGVHQDGLVHISALADSFVKDPRSIVKAGQIVKVKIMEVDQQRQRIGLSMRLNDSAADATQSGRPKPANTTNARTTAKPRNSSKTKTEAAPPSAGLAAAFASAKKRR